ncbi:RNase H domain-containing protein [Trichonephila clavipes]|uniref:RNase H domain-containing protein n=1 Tax=Trichonephila clavipes TaxID=2585209 RepID=A0A8X7B9A0_TRICX|nr:RNase H domain-containing protein [Trichonephila clavipes]
MNSNSTPASSNILDCKKLLQSLSEYSKKFVLQWIPGHCGVAGNELVHHLTKKRASIQHTARKAVPFTSDKRIIKKKMNDISSIQYAERNSNKIWWNNLKDLPMWPRRKAVAEFRLITGRDSLFKHLHRIHVARTSFCTLRDFREDMEADYIRHCPALKGSSLCDLYCRLGDMVGLFLAFCTKGCVLDLGPSQWLFMMQKLDSGRIIVYCTVHEISLECLFNSGALCKIKS